ncbi:MAG: hypothetical protein EHM56_07865, partial [Chloroflexi bacterium]
MTLRARWHNSWRPAPLSGFGRNWPRNRRSFISPGEGLTMERNYSTIEGTSRGYKVLVALLGVMVGVFIVSFLVAYLKGQQVWGVSNIIPWGQLITFYIFFIGLSAGAIIISSLSYVFKREIYEPIGRMAVFMGILLMVGAMS